jgi:adenylate cyclase
MPDVPATRNSGKRFAAKILLPMAVAGLSLLLTHEPALNLVIVDRLELASLDFRFHARGPRSFPADSSHVIIVEISRESHESVPEKWPWPRSHYARLVRNLARAGAKVVGIDIFFASRDEAAPWNDSEFRAAIRETGIVALAGKREVDIKGRSVWRKGENFSNIFYHADSSLGFVNTPKDADEVVRRYFPSLPVDSLGKNIPIPTFGFAVLNKYFGLGPAVVPEPDADAFRYQGVDIPRYDETTFFINFFGPSRSFPHVRFVDVIDDETFETVDEARSGQDINNFSDPDYGYLYDQTFQDKIVLVGSTLPEDQDIHSVPVAAGDREGENKMFGVEIHANLVESLIRHEFLTRQSLLSETIMVLILSFLTFTVTSRIKGAKTRHHALVELNGFLLAVAVLAIMAFVALRLFIDMNYVVALVSPSLAIVGGYFASTAYHFVAERKQRVMIKMMFSTYVAPSIVDELISNPDKLTLGGERKELSALFSDIEGFTTLAESTPPEELVGLLNEYLSAMTQVILRNNGTLDKFEGDLIMAFWGAPVPQTDHAVRACTAALQMQETLGMIRYQWGFENKPPLFARIGINTGEMVVGNMGSAEKFNYTVIGDSVNIASRLEGANKIYRTGIIISESTVSQLDNLFVCRELDTLTVKGRTEPIRIFELLCSAHHSNASAWEQFLLHYNRGLGAYRERRWSDARTAFEAALTRNPVDHTTQLYLQRIQELEINPPGPDWNGVFAASNL